MTSTDVASNRTRCPECGGTPPDGETCADRFDVLLALDHSRQEPWGSRHALAFAAYTLQHSAHRSINLLQNCLSMLCRVYEHGDDLAQVVHEMRRAHRSRDNRTNTARKWPYNNRSMHFGQTFFDQAPGNFAVTISDLREFDQAAYPALLDAWCIATMKAWRTSGETMRVAPQP